MLVSNGSELSTKLVDLSTEKVTLVLFDGHESVGGYETGFEVGQRTDAKVFGQGIYFLIHDERNEKTQFGNLDSNRLDINAVYAIFNEVKFPAIIR